MIKALIFDYDGTLSNRTESVYCFFNDYLRPFVPQLSDIEFEAMVQDLMYFDVNGINEFDLRMPPFMDRYGHLFPEGFEEDFKKNFINKVWSYNVLKEETLEVLEKLKEKYKLALLSNGSSTVQHNKIDHVGIEKHFDVVVVSGDVGIHKPDPKLFEYTLDKLNVRADEAMMIGDVFSTDILGAVRAGIKTVWLVEDEERPAFAYKGYRIRNLKELYEILEGEK
jgi:putative hydrolase of the HAD superfamily